MIYICEECGFMFYRVSETDTCPYCEKHFIRVATDEEIRSNWCEPLN